MAAPPGNRKGEHLKMASTDFDGGDDGDRNTTGGESPDQQLSRQEMLAVFKQVSGRAMGSPTEFRELTLQVMSRIWSRGRLSMRERRLITIAVLAASGAGRELDVHVRAALQAGDLDIADLDEASMQIALYGGWPRGAALQSAIADAAADPGPAPVDNRRQGLG